jgi:adenylate cyclase
MNSNAQSILNLEELKAEKISTSAQLSFITSLFLFYLAAPKGFESEQNIWFEPVRALFYIYIPILAIRLYFLFKTNRVINWILYPFLFLDILAITLLIFSYHLQYRREFSLSLHAPTFMYYFILIALRTLAYDSMKALFVGLFAAMCWTIMTAYAFFGSGLTRISDFSNLLNPKVFILGVEIDKILSLLVFTGISTFAIYRRKKLLFEFSKKSVYANAIERFVGKDAFASMIDKNINLKLGIGVKRIASTMMIDLRGFSKMSSEIPPEELIQHLTEYQKIVASSVFKFGGSVDKYMGDGVLAHFGAVSQLDDHAAKALQSAEQIYIELREWCRQKHKQGLTFDFGLAISLGPVVFGAIGHEERMEITVIGEAVNLSAKIEKHTKNTGCRILTTVKTFESAKKYNFSPKLKVNFFSKENIHGIQHPIDLIGFEDE